MRSPPSKRQRLEQHGVDQREHRRVGPDTERQSGHERHRKPGMQAHHAERVAQIVQHWCMAAWSRQKIRSTRRRLQRRPERRCNRSSPRRIDYWMGSSEPPGIDADRVLVAAVLRRARSFETLVHDHQRLCWHIINRMVRHPDDTRELCQDTFLRVHRYLHQYRFESALKTWIGQVAYSVARRHLERKRIPLAEPAGDEDPSACRARRRRLRSRGRERRCRARRGAACRDRGTAALAADRADVVSLG